MTSGRPRDIAKVRGPWRSQRAGRILKIISPVVFLLVSAACLALAPHILQGVEYSLKLGPPVAGAVLAIGIRLESKGALEVMNDDRRAPVLYLRSFRDDLSDADKTNRFGAWSNFEHALAAALGALGPVVAIGKPDEWISRNGAWRLYVRHDQWKAVAAELMDSARLIVIRAASTSGVSWELRRIRQTIEPSRLLLLVVRPRYWFGVCKGREFGKMIRAIEQHLGCALPPSVGKCRFFCFDDNWRGIAFSRRTIRSFWIDEEKVMRQELGPVLSRLPARSWEEPERARLLKLLSRYASD